MFKSQYTLIPFYKDKVHNSGITGIYNSEYYFFPINKTKIAWNAVYPSASNWCDPGRIQ